MVECRVVNNNGFKWNISKGICVKGYLYDRNNYIYKKENLINYFIDVNDEQQFRDKLIKSDGCFSVILENDKYIFVSVDRIRSIPIFYSIFEDNIYISDSIYEVQKFNGDNTFDNISKKEFLLTGYVTGSDTLYKNIKQLNAGEYLVYEKQTSKLHIKSYFSYKYNDFYTFTEQELIDKLHDVHLSVFNNLIKSLNGKTAVIPLSGGYDSRLIAVMLKKLGYRKVICFTYGKKNNEESLISKKVADYLGYDWIFIEYTHDKWYEFINSSEAKEYFKFASNQVSLPHIQDWIAVNEMKEKKLIPEDSIFIPGHAAGFLEGSQVSIDFILNDYIKKEYLIKLIFKKHYSLWNWGKDKKKYSKIFADKIGNVINLKDVSSSKEAASLYEEWGWKERQAKFIANSIRVYEFFGYEWRLPLWDADLMDYWSRINLDLKRDRKLYIKYDQAYFKKLNNFLKNYNQTEKNDGKFKFLYNKSRTITFLKNTRDFFDKKHNKYNSKDVYYNNPFQWYGILKFDEFNKNYTGIEIINSYLTKLYLEWIAKSELNI